MDLVEEKQEKKADVEILTAIRNLIQSDGLTQKEISKKIGVSQTVISLYLNDEYNGDIQKLEGDLLKFISEIKSQRKYKRVKLEFEKTSVAAKIFNIAQICQHNGEMALITGSSGVGKTTSIYQYAKEHTGVIVIDPDEKISVRTLLIYIGKALKLSIIQNEPSADFANKIVDKLKHSGKLIIVDEAENLDISCFKILRKIHDRCDFTIGLLFCGTEVLANKISSLHGENNYIFTRFAYIDSLERLTQADTKALVLQVFPNCDENLIQMFYKISKANARILFNLLKRTADMVASSDDELNPKMIKAAGYYVGAAKHD